MRNNAEKVIEALLFVSSQPVDVDTLCQAALLSELEVLSALEGLEHRYSMDNSGIVLHAVAGGYQLLTNPDCAEAIERLRGEARPAPLSSAANEVLASVLYLGPLTRAGISAVRGVNSDAVVRALLERGLLQEAGVSHEAPGAPALLDITPDFLLAAGAVDRHDFPSLDTLVTLEELEQVRERVRAEAGGEED